VSELTDNLSFITPDWPAPENIKALVTTRQDGVSLSPFDSFNLGLHVGDIPEHVLHNRQQLQQRLGTPHAPQWLQQVHCDVAVEAKTNASIPEADACFTSTVGLPCAVMTADCLPVLFCTTTGDRVAAAHAGWRGLADGVLEAVVSKLQVPANELLVWLGPAIGPLQFEVGDDVRDAFLSFSAECAGAFVAHPDKLNHWFADLYKLAGIRLQAKNIGQIYGGDFCTFTDRKRFFSYRRDGVTGRMVSLIWRSE
jgi:purine-nucleoside/S-methyl-5'-thioadenosine phosphorylase / adenosine deaminase